MNELEIVEELATDFGWEAGVASGALWFFGPTLFAIRRNVAKWADFHSANMLRLNQRVLSRVEVGGADGLVHPRVAQQVIEQGPWIADDVQQEYLAGLLIASRTPDGKSERGAYYARLVGALTAQQIRLHQAIYASLAAGPLPDGLDLGSSDDTSATGVWFPLDGLTSWFTAETDEARGELSETAFALHQQGLLGGFVASDEKDAITSSVPQPTRPAFAASPTTLGIILYLWALGEPTHNPNLLGNLTTSAPAELTRTPAEWYIHDLLTPPAPF